MIWFTLLWWLMFVAVWMVGLGTFFGYGIALDKDEPRMLKYAIPGTFLFVVLIWACWAVYPFTAMAV